MKILVVEGDGVHRRWLRASLTQRGHEVRRAHNGAWGLKMWKAFGPFDLVIGELTRDGLDLIASIRAIDPLQALVMQTRDPSFAPPLGVPVIHKPSPIHRLLRLMQESVQPSLPLRWEVTVAIDSAIRDQPRGRRITLDEFVRKLAASGAGYDLFRFGDAVYVEMRDRNCLFGFRFLRGELDGGWIHPSPSDWKRVWGRWLKHLEAGSSTRKDTRIA